VEGSLLPEDLRVWLDAGTLAELTERAVRDHQASPTPVPAADLSPATPAANPLLTLLTYCYAAGIYSSEVILDQLNRDHPLPVTASDSWLEADNLRRFRRTHRPEVEECLGEVLWSACRLAWPRLRHQCQDRPAGDPICHTSQGGEESLRNIIERDVRRRVSWAVELDSMAMDC
jgi:hypothetical protein